MFTVITAKKEFIDSIHEYSLFLKPFMDKSNVIFCEWLPSEESPAASVPTLEQAVKNRDKWRLIVIADDLDGTKKNPFDAVDYIPPVLDPISDFYKPFDEANPEEEDLFYDKQKKHVNEVYSEYLKSFRPARHAAYEKAAKMPLARLMAFLNEKPYEPNEKEVIGDNPLYMEYLADTRKKLELREQIIGDRELRVEYPTEIICVTTRTDYDLSYDIKTSWEMPDDSKYSRFYDWNLYYDKMRYLIFDMNTKTHQSYLMDQVRFLYTLLVLANTDTPRSALKPNRVYSVICENDDDELKKLFARYDQKLSATKEGIAKKLDELLHAAPETLSDYDVRSEFCRSVTVPVTLLDKFDTRDMFADKKLIGLSNDCPGDESTSWRARFKAARRSVIDFLKLPRRALKKATDDFRFLNTLESDRIQFLNEFQIEDIEEFVAKEELQMVGTHTENIHEPEEYFKRMDESDKEIKEKIDSRMTKKTTVLLALVSILAYLIGFIPFVSKYTAEWKPFIGTLIMALGGTAAFAIVAFIALFFLRSPLVKLVKKFNTLMHGIVSSITGASDQFGRYLSHACNMMRGYCVLNYRENNEPENMKNVRVLRKHLSDIDNAREEMLEVFGPISDTSDVEPEEEVEPYLYDFSRSTDYKYPIPFLGSDRRKIDFLQAGNEVEVPIAFIKSISAIREELYDND